jgi:photosystem II stability/assembly factor-like uncharacterized protein
MPRLALSLVCLAGAVFAACLRAQDGAERAGAWSPLARHGGSLRGLAVVDAAVAWASGSGGAIWRTTDGGASWRNVAPREAAAWDFRDVEAWDGNRALAMVAGTPARVLRTDDGGASWRTVLADERKGAFFDAMAFAGDVGVLFGDPIDGAFSVWTTRDGGSTWKAVRGAELPAPLPGEAAFAASGSCVAVAGEPGAETFWIATGGGPRARMLRGAANGWTAIDLPLPAGAPSRGAFGQAWRGDRGIVVGGDYADTAIGGAACTSDGGRTWQAWPEFGGFRSAVAWVDDEHALAVGSHGETSLHFDRSASSTDGAIGFHALAVGRDGAVLAAGADGRICRRSSQSRRPLRLARLFADHMVVPAATSVRVRGFATAGARVRLAASWGVAAEAMVANDGTFGCELATPREPGGPHGFTMSCGEERVEVRDVLAGDVWLASGQSNMEMQLGKAGWSAGIDGHEAAIAAADLPTLRVFTVTRRASDQPQDDCEGVWQVCTPAVAHEFSAVGFHFARALQQARQRPFGLVVSAWGGTVAEAWTSAVGLREFPEFAGQLAALRGGSDAPPAAQRAAFWRAVEAAPGGEFAPVAMPDVWSRSGLGGFDGAAEYRLVVTVPAVWAGSDCVLELGPIDDMDHATWDGERIGGMERDGAWATPRAYAIPGRLVTAGDHELRLRVADTSGEGGLAGPAAALIPPTLRGVNQAVIFATGHGAGEHDGQQQGVEVERGGVDQPELHAERDFGEVDDEKKPRSGADEGHFVHAPREEVEGGDGAGGVGQHGGDARAPTGGEAEPRMVAHAAHHGRAQALSGGEGHESENDPAEQDGEGLVGDARHEPPTADDAGQRGGQELEQIRPVGVAPVKPHGEKVGENHQRQQRAGRFLGGKKHGKERH